MNSVNKCPICGEIFDLSDYERYENHLLSNHPDVMAVVEKLDNCWYDIELEERKEILLDLVKIGFGNDGLPKHWKGRDTLVDVYQLHGWETIVYIGEALRREQLEVEDMRRRFKYENNKV